MASGSFYGSIVNEQRAYIFWSYSQDIANRKTTLTLTLKVKRMDSGAYTYKSNAPYEIECPNNTTAKSGTFDYDITDVSVGSYLTIASVVKTLQHDSTGVYGAGSITAEGILDLTGTSVGTLTTGVGTITIPDIPVESTVESVSGSTMGGILGITLDAASSGFTHNLTYAFGTLTGTIVNGLTGSLSPVYSWNTSALRDAMIQQSPSSASKSLTITCKTYSGTTLLGTTTKVVTLYVPSDAVPSISNVSNEDALQILGVALKTWYVQSKSKPKVLFQCAGYLGSTIVSRELKINGVTVSNALVGSFYEGTALSSIAFSSGNVFRVTVTDSRGKTATTGDVAISQVAAYSIPGFTSCLVQRCLQDGTLNGDGTWLKITPDWYFSSVVAASVAQNAIVTKNWKIGTGANTAFSSGDGVAFVVSNGAPSGSDGNFAINSSYVITVTVTDNLGGSAVMAITVPSAKRLLSLNAAGTGVAVGKAAEVGATNFEVDITSKFNKPMLIADASIDFNALTDPGLLHLGIDTGYHLKFDYQAVQAMNAGAAGKFYAQYYGGGMQIGSSGIASNLDLWGAMYISGKIEPRVDNTVDLGADSYRLRDIKMAGKLYMGSTTTATDYIEFDDANNIFNLYADARRLAMTINSNGMFFDSYEGEWIRHQNTYGSYNLYWSGSYNYFRPGADNSYYLGSTSYRWKQLVAGTTTISTSDSREKKDFAEIDKAIELTLALKPMQFKLIDGDSGRIHYGFTAQQLKEAMASVGIQDCAAYIRGPLKDNVAYSDDLPEEEVRYGIRYEELIAPLVATVQSLSQRIDALEAI